MDPEGPDFKNLLLIIAAWLAIEVLVDPIGNFPLNDDWAYGWTVKTWLDTGRYQLSDWTATNLLSQSLWGAAFCLPFGFSFTTLRASALLLGLIGVLSTYGLLREANAPPTLSLIGALTVALNPVYVDVSNTFNSDVPSFAFLVVSLYVLVRGLRIRSTAHITVGVGLGLVAVLNRQSSIVILIALGPAILMRYGVTVRTLLVAGCPALLGLLGQMLYSRWLRLHGVTPYLFGFQIEKLGDTWSAGAWGVATTYVDNAVVMSVYLGLFAVPFLLAGGAARIRRLSLRGKGAATTLIMLMCALGVARLLDGKRMPLATNILEPFSVGPQMLDGYSANLAAGTKMVFALAWTMLTLMGFVAAAILVVCLISVALGAVRTPDETIPRWMLMLTMVSALLYFGAIGGLDRHYWYDRYLIPLLPLAMMPLAPSRSVGTIRGRRIATAAALLMLTLWGGFSASATHDYLAWNRVRWQALDALVDRGVPAARIFGGFEFNGWHFGQRLDTCNPAGERRSGQVDQDAFNCLWGVDRGGFRYEYRLAFTQAPPGYVLANEYAFRRWLPWSIQRLYVFRRSE
jgi:4-amino-4-deoxy-L-arabinose transferase-like glycosyltransferase